MLIGVLALQGDFAKHSEMLRSLGMEVREVRKAQDLKDCEGLVIPGGESTVMIRQIDFIGLREPLLAFAQKKPIFGTCAGLILMSRHVQKFPFPTLDLLNLEVERNAYGRQVESFEAPVIIHASEGHPKKFPGFFIRAPRISACGKEVEVLASYQGEPVLVRQGRHLGACFHPELSSNASIHLDFIRQIRACSH